jgi:hypothetical protein
MILRQTALAAAVAATLALRPAPDARLYSFHTPSGNIGCMADNEGGRWELRCDISEKEWSGGGAGPDCDLDDGDSLGMLGTGRSYWVCHGDTVLGQGRALGYGEIWRAGPFTCTSTRAGLTCRNAGQHGFFLSRARYRVF